MKHTTAVARLKLVESAARQYLYITFSFDPLQVSNGSQDHKLRSFLQQCKQIYQQQTHRQGAADIKLSEKERVSNIVTGGGKREAREAAQISARSYEGIQKRREQSSHDQLPASVGTVKKKFPELYVQGASSFTDLTSRRAEHKHMIRGTGRGNMGRHSSTSTESLDQDLFTPFSGALDRVHSMESGISQQQNTPWRSHSTDQSANLSRSASQGNLPPEPGAIPHSRPPARSLARSTESFHTQTFGLPSSRRTPSYLQLSGEDVSEQLSHLEERVGVLASRFLYERQDMFKQILRACKFN